MLTTKDETVPTLIWANFLPIGECMLAVLGGKLPNLQRLNFRIAHFPDNDILNNCINNIHEKLLDSDWLRAVQFKCNTNENYTSKFWIMIG